MHSFRSPLILFSLVAFAAATPVHPRFYSQPRFLHLVNKMNYYGLSSVPVPMTETGQRQLLSALMMGSSPTAGSVMPLFSKRDTDPDVAIPSSSEVASCQPAATATVESDPGLLPDPNISPSDASDVDSTHILARNANDCVTVEGNVTSPTTLHSPTSLTNFFVVLGGSVAGILALGLCIFLVLNRHIRKAFRTARQLMFNPRKIRLLLSWPPYIKSRDEQKPLGDKTDTSELRSHVSPDTSDVFARVPAAACDGNNCPAVLYSTPRPSPAPALGIAQETKQPVIPIRPPRPPSMDSPALISSTYFADLDDLNFYKFPNPVIRGSVSCEMSESPTMPLVVRKSTRSPNMFGNDIPARHTIPLAASSIMSETAGDSVGGEISERAPLYVSSPPPSPSPF